MLSGQGSETQLAGSVLSRSSCSRRLRALPGSAPAEHVHPEVIEAMREVGVDLEGRVPRKVEQADAEWRRWSSRWPAATPALHSGKALHRLGPDRSARPAARRGETRPRRDRQADDRARRRARFGGRPEVGRRDAQNSSNPARAGDCTAAVLPSRLGSAANGFLRRARPTLRATLTGALRAVLLSRPTSFRPSGNRRSPERRFL